VSQQLIQLIVSGFAVGSVYALVGLAFILVNEATGVVNFATGQFVTIGCFVAVTTVIQMGLPLFLAYPAALLAMAVFGIVFYAIVFRPLQDRSVVTVIIGTVMIGIVIQNGALMTWGSVPFRPRSPFGRQVVDVFGAAISAHALFVIAVAFLLIGLLYGLIYRTSIGARMRAVAQDRDAARLMGIGVGRLFVLTWVIAGLLTGAAGILVGPMWFADVNMGDPIALKAFAAIIIGGFSSVPGAIVGGILVGLAEMFGAAYISSAYKDGLVFLVMILFLLVRPQGIFGERIGERA
jgi:branched-chain amino acid transport system permease protein